MSAVYSMTVNRIEMNLSPNCIVSSATFAICTTLDTYTDTLIYDDNLFVLRARGNAHALLVDHNTLL